MQHKVVFKGVDLDKVLDTTVNSTWLPVSKINLKFCLFYVHPQKAIPFVYKVYLSYQLKKQFSISNKTKRYKAVMCCLRWAYVKYKIFQCHKLYSSTPNYILSSVSF